MDKYSLAREMANEQRDGSFSTDFTYGGARWRVTVEALPENTAGADCPHCLEEREE